MSKIRQIEHSMGYGVYWKFSIVTRYFSGLEFFERFKERFYLQTYEDLSYEAGIKRYNILSTLDRDTIEYLLNI